MLFIIFISSFHHFIIQQQNMNIKLLRHMTLPKLLVPWNMLVFSLSQNNIVFALCEHGHSPLISRYEPGTASSTNPLPGPGLSLQNGCLITVSITYTTSPFHHFIIEQGLIARSAYYFRSGPFEEIRMSVCVSVWDFRDFTEGDMGFGQGPI